MSPKTTYYASRPVVKVDGSEEARVADELLALHVEETVEGLARCELRVSNWGLKDGVTTFLFFDRATLDFGSELSVTLGPPGKSGEVFKGKITGIEGVYPLGRPPEIAILAEDRLQDLRMTRRTRSFESVSDGDVVNQIASGHGMSAQVDHDGPTWGVLTQVNQSDLAFLRERARAADALMWVEDDAIHFVARERAERETVEMTYGRELREMTVLADLAHQRTKVCVGGWDVSSKEGVTGEAEAGAMGSELGGLTGGAAILSQALGDRVDHVAHLVAFSQAEATALAEARYRDAARRFVSGVAQAEGDGRVRAGSRVALDGLGALFDGEYAVVEVRHTFDGELGYRTHMQVERPGIAS